MITLLARLFQLAVTIAIPAVLSVAGHTGGLGVQAPGPSGLPAALLHRALDTAAPAVAGAWSRLHDAADPLPVAASRRSPALSGPAAAPPAPSAATSPPAPQAPPTPQPQSPPSSSGEPARKPAPPAGPARALPPTPPARAEAPAQPAPGGTSGQAASGDATVAEAPDETEEEEGPSPGMTRATTPEVSFSGSEVIVPAGQYHRGDLVNIGGHVTVNGEVHGSVVVIGGVLTIAGAVRGDVVSVASRTSLLDGSKISGEVVNVGGSLRRSGNVAIHGQYTSVDFFDFGRLASGRGALAYLVYMLFWGTMIVTAIRFLGVLVVAAIAPHRIEGALAEPRPSWILAFLLGFVVRCFVGVLVIILILPCVTIPVAAALWIISRILIWMGIASISLLVGRRIGKTVFKTDLSYFGAILTGFLIYAVLCFIPIFGFFAGAIMSCTGLGLMLLTRFGKGKNLKPVIPVVPPGGTPPMPPPGSPMGGAAAGGPPPAP